MLRILFLGDIIGKIGRILVKSYLADHRKEVDICIANGENASGGYGLTPKVVDQLFEMGIDVITTGNHIWDRKEIIPHLNGYRRLLRPANYPPDAPGYGKCIAGSANGVYFGIVNLQGRVFMPSLDCPFRRALEEIESMRKKTPFIIVDFHGEASSEKVALGRFLDGKVSAVVGTHTHIQTADECILPNQTAYITDAGMVGSSDSIIGMETKGVLKRFITGIPYRMEAAKGKGILNGVLITVNGEGRAEEIQRIQEGG
ncbi:MAG TPA: TIGR00282 family metallophosphoesterase [Candidatus Omnitrophica bacterium]|nr:TIGR00282 family metallophosphoesterase [Candidatus Omnitrophota bacterium]